MSDTNTEISGKLTRFSLDRRISVLVMVMTIVVVGIIATVGIPLELFPRGYQEQSLYVYVPWQNAPAEEVLQKITLPLEEELSTVRNLDGINSFSFFRGCNVFLRFKQGTDMGVAYREVRDRVQRARTQFPDDIDRVFINKEDVSGIPVGAIGLAIDPNLTDYYDLIQKQVVQPLSRIDGVANVEANGLEEKEIIIEVDKQLTEANGLNIYELSQDLGGDNFTMASGTVEDGRKKFLLRSVATYTSLEQLENRYLTPTVRLKDVAKLRYEEAEKRYAVRVNGRPAVAAVIFKEGEANAVDVSRKIRAAMEEMQQNPRLAGIDMEELFNQGAVVEESIHNLIKGGWDGAWLSAGILFVFMRRFRMTTIITLSIPVSLLIALIAMFFMNETLNILTMLGLVISVGNLVDNSIVVAENIYRLFKEGTPRRAACIQGAGEIALPITLSTLTTVVVFLPVALVEGQGQFFLMRLALPITVSLLASLFVALVFVPLCVYLTLPARSSNGGNRFVQRVHKIVDKIFLHLYEMTFGWMNRAYTRALAWSLRHRFDIVLMVIAVFALTQIVAMKKVKVSPMSEEDQTGFNIDVEMSNEYSFEETVAFFTQLEKILEIKKSEYGLRGYFVFYRPRGGRVEGWFEKGDVERPSAKETAEKILKDFPEKPGIKYYFGRENQAEDGNKKDTFMVLIEGEDSVVLDGVAEQLRPVFANVQGVVGVKLENEQQPSEMALVVDRDRATASGVNPTVIAGLVGYALRGNMLPKYNDDGREIPVRIRFREEDRESLQDLSNFKVPTASGEVLPISALTDAQMLKTPKGIFRRDKKISRSITLELQSENSHETRERLSALQSRIDLPEGITFGSIIVTNQNEELASMVFAGLVSIVFIYLLMGFLFESFILPLSIILTIPLAGLGVIWIHYFTGRDMDFLGVVGCILLTGVVVNNGIVLIDYINRLRLDGMSRADALVQATDLRFRPIMMTALTTILGMLPLTVSEPGELGLSYKSFGLTLIGGMSTATLLTLLVVPIFYTFFDDTRETFARQLKLLLNRREKTALTPAEIKPS